MSGPSEGTAEELQAVTAVQPPQDADRPAVGPSPSIDELVAPAKKEDAAEKRFSAGRHGRRLHRGDSDLTSKRMEARKAGGNEAGEESQGRRSGARGQEERKRMDRGGGGDSGTSMQVEHVNGEAQQEGHVASTPVSGHHPEISLPSEEKLPSSAGLPVLGEPVPEGSGDGYHMGPTPGRQVDGSEMDGSDKGRAGSMKGVKVVRKGRHTGLGGNEDEGGLEGSGEKEEGKTEGVIHGSAVEEGTGEECENEKGSNLRPVLEQVRGNFRLCVVALLSVSCESSAPVCQIVEVKKI